LDAEDVAQEVMVRVCQKITELNDPKAFIAWLGSIVVNESRRQMMKNSRYNETMQMADHLEDVASKSTAYVQQEFADDKEDRQVVVDAISFLPERQREAIILHYFDGLNVKETALSMGIPIQNASNYLQIAREKIKVRLEKQAFSAPGVAGMSGASGAPRATGLSFGAAALPLGTLLTETLHQESLAFTPLHEEWTTNVIGQCKEAIAATQASPTATTSATKATGSALAHLPVALVVAATILVGATTAGILGSTPKEAVQAPPAAVAATVVFTSENADFAYLNPTEAELQLDTTGDGLTMAGWEITSVDGTAVLYSGQGNIVEAPFTTMRESGQVGEYMLVFHYEDSAGNGFQAGHNFVVRQEAEETAAEAT
ncbi:MAG: sigma-70 family RNA polymerase sigma factor, partial [Eggerthellaceae bacterium]|nr:sigma-70 family RNA polymerase sigma factor [Eggerthellaceae bacterium]